MQVSHVDEVVPLEAILCTDALDRRPARAPDYETGSRALVSLSQALADQPTDILQKLAETILQTLDVGSAGVSLLAGGDGGDHFYWPAIAGLWKPHIGGGTPRDFGPCGDVLDRNSPLLFSHIERRYAYFTAVTPSVEECLLVPFYVDGEAVGTIWAVTHDDRRKFDKEDLRQLLALSSFASAAHQAHAALSMQDEHCEVRAGLSALVESSRDAVVGKTLDGIITSWNHAAERLFGYAAAEAIGQPIALIIPAERDREGVHALDRIRLGETVDRLETERQTKNGQRIQVSLTISPIVDAKGRIFGSSMVARDLTEHKRMEAALRESEIRYRRLFQTAKDGILILDASNGTIIDANAFMCGLLGLELANVLGKELWEIGLFEDIVANKAAFEKLRQNGYIRYDHLPVMKPTGETTQVEFISNVYRESDRMVAQCNVRDISARALLEDKIKLQAEAMADLHRRKDEFLAMLSHELRNPLAPIRNATHLLRLQERGNENLIQRQAREVIERQVATLTRLVSDLLEVSRVVTGRIRLIREIVDLSQIVRQALEVANPLFGRRHQEVLPSLLCPTDPVWVSGDATRLEQVVVNLLNNASKFSDASGCIEVGLERRDNHAQLRVRDSGVGIAPEMLPHIFDLFAQADRSLDRAEGGLGIGLHLVQRLVELHGGTVEASSAGIGQGSEFLVRLPLVPGPGEPSLPLVEDQVEPGSAKGLRVLVVDDNVDACAVLATVLQLQGYGVRIAYDGHAALEAATVWRPDVVLLDIGLPGLNGYEVARRVRATPVLKNMKLVAITGYGTEHDLQLGREAGFDVQLVKPVDPEEVEKLLATFEDSRSR